MGFVKGLCDHDPFTRRQTIGLDHDRSAMPVDIGMRFLGPRKTAIGRGRNGMACHEGFGKVFRTFQLCCCGARPEDPESAGSEGVYDASCQRPLGPDNRQCDPLSLNQFCEGDDAIGRRTVDGYVDHAGFASSAPIARCYKNGLYLR